MSSIINICTSGTSSNWDEFLQFTLVATSGLALLGKVTFTNLGKIRYVPKSGKFYEF